MDKKVVAYSMKSLKIGKGFVMTDDISRKIQSLADGRFDNTAISEFISEFQRLSAHESIIDFFLQISTDMGDELEIGFFTQAKIADITLSKGNIFSCSFSLSKVKNIELQNFSGKWVLTILGKKKIRLQCC